MPMEIYGEMNEPDIKIFNSPVIELICAVHLLTDAAHHQYEAKWAEDTIGKLTADGTKAVQIIRQFPAGGIFLLNFVLNSEELQSIDRFIDYLEQVNVIDFYFYILNEDIEKSKISKAFTERKERYRIQEKVKWIIEEQDLMAFFDNPNDVKDKTLKFIKEVYHNGFLTKLERCQDKMESGIQYINAYLGKDPIESVLEKVTGRQKKVFMGYKEYCIIPSYFVSPQICIRIYSGDRLYVVFDCRLTRDKREALLDELSTILKVIDDKSRMEILRILVNDKSYGKAISDRVGISTPTVSHHLDILKQAGFVKEEKIRNIKYFYAEKEKIKKVIEDINKYFFGAE